MRRSFQRRGWVLMEIMIAVAIFALAVLGLGQVMHNGMNAMKTRNKETQMRQLLENEMNKILSGTAPLTDKSSVDIDEGIYAGSTVTTYREQLKLKNENDQELVGLYSIKIEVSWKEDNGDTEVREISFHYLPRQNQ